MIALRYIYSDGFTNRVDLVELLGRGRLLIEHFARLHGGIIRVEVPDENRIFEEHRAGPQPAPTSPAESLNPPRGVAQTT